MDAVELAQSGHPGAPMGFADVAEVLWREFLRFNPNNPHWPDRDRVVLSNGHASMLLYAVLHLTGYTVSIQDIKQFRQLHSKTAGHPEYSECPGIETTTGPLGQGFANAVGMALAEQQLASEFNRPEVSIVDHRTWVILGDGCLMEGISHEAASFAGTFGLNKLIALYDSNGISIDGETKHWFTEDVATRFNAYGWRVIDNVDAHNNRAIRAALNQAITPCNQPTLVICNTKIGFGAPSKSGTAKAHGAPLGQKEIDAVRKELEWDCDPFEIPEELYRQWNQCERGEAVEQEWSNRFEQYVQLYPKSAGEFERRQNGELPSSFEKSFEHYVESIRNEPQQLETRKASGSFLDTFAPIIPELIGGSADLSGSNNTLWKGAKRFDEGGRYIHFGVREFAMTAISNGIALHQGLIPYSGTFLIFMEYARNGVRLASLMGIRQILVYTHDSVGLGEDGPTHQPIEQLTNLRTTPHLSVWRPSDSLETAFAWRAALQRQNGPTAIVLTRQKTKPQVRTTKQVQDVEKGGYILAHETHSLSLLLIATGSELEVAVQVAEQLEAEGFGVRVISVPSVDQFMRQSQSYREEVLPPDHRVRMVIEAAHTDYWAKFVGLDGVVLGIDRYGVSAPGHVALDHLGINVEHALSLARSILA